MKIATPLQAVRIAEVPRLFHSLSSARKTCAVVFERAHATQTVYFKDGVMVFASSVPETEFLSRILLDSGAITEQHYAATREISKSTGKSQDALLIELNFITPDIVNDAKRERAKKNILNLFLWNDGTYRIEEGMVPPADFVPLQMSTANLILAGIDRIDWKTTRKSLPSIETVLRPASDVSALFQSITLSAEQKNILSLINGERTIAELCALSEAGDFNTLKTLYVFQTLRMIEVGAIKSEEEAAFVREAVDAAVSEQNHEGYSSTDDETRVIQKAFEAMEKQSFYEVFNVTETFTPQEIKKAYFRLSKQYHPDRHLAASMGTMKSKLEALFIRINEAYTTLSDPEKRAAYDRDRLTGGREKREQEQHERTGKAKEQFERGLREYQSQNYWAALDLFDWACRIAPENPGYLYYRGLTLMQMPRRWTEAAECFKKTMEMDKKRAEPCIALGAVYLKSGDKRMAASAFSEALKRDPRSEPAKKGLASSSGK